MPILTKFQLYCERALNELLEFRGIGVHSRALVGNGETYIHVRLEGRDMEVWIYDDEVELRAGRLRRNFESTVFKHDEERIAAFVKLIEEQL